MEQEKIKRIEREAHEILERFGKAIERVVESDINKVEEKKTNESRGFREEKDGLKADDDFRKRFFANAPKKDDDCIIAEKGKWE